MSWVLYFRAGNKCILSSFVIQHSQFSSKVSANTVWETGIEKSAELLKVRAKKEEDLFFLCGEDDFAHGPDVSRAVWFCDLQVRERGHDVAGEVPEGRVGGPDGVLKHLQGKTHSKNTETYSICMMFSCNLRLL